MNALPLTVHPSATALGATAGERALATIRTALDRVGSARVMLAAAPSQSPVLDHLAASDVDFGRVVFFHMDDYLGLPSDSPQGFANWLVREFLARLAPAPTFHRMDTQLPPQEAADAYARAMGTAPFDLTLCGLGVNAHLAFNDPPADFEDPRPTRIVTLDERSRRQQVEEGHFPDIGAVPQRAVTVTIPRLLHAGHVICSVLGAAKRTAVAQTLGLDPTPQVPGTALKLHPHTELHVDAEAMDDE